MKIRKRFIFLFLVLLFFVFTVLWRKRIVFNTFKNQFINIPNLNTTTNCDSNLWNRVYSPDRIYKINDCVKVSGIVRWTEEEEDGDVHILIKLDDKYKSQVNIFNKILMGGNLITEIICHGDTPDEEIQKACEGYKSNLEIPKRGDRVEISGPFVIDISYGWTEIHPVDSLSILNSEAK